MKEGWRRLRWVLVYGIFYMITFYLIENRTVRIHIIHTKWDNKIPFCEYFIIPYVLWFVFVAATVLYFAFFNKSRQEYFSLITNLGIGMTVFIVISWIYPNGHILRPIILGDGIFDRAVRILHEMDTPTNIFPSIHVFNSLACCIALMKNDRCRSHKILSWSIVILTVLIIMSTVLLKQHSVLDIIGAFALCLIVYPFVYPKDTRITAKERHARINSLREI